MNIISTDLKVKYFIFLTIIFLSTPSISQSPGGVSTGLAVWLKAGSGTTTAGANLTGWTVKVLY